MILRFDSNESSIYDQSKKVRMESFEDAVMSDASPLREEENACASHRMRITESCHFFALAGKEVESIEQRT